MGETVIKYYTIHCPKCIVLEKLMNEKNIVFDVIDNEDEVKKIGAENNTNFAPFAFINGVFYDTKQLQQWIKEQE